MKKLSVLLVLISAFVFSGCAQKMAVVTPQLQEVSEPTLNKETTKSIGEELVIQGISSYVKAFAMINDLPDGSVTAGRYQQVGEIRYTQGGNSDPQYGPITEGKVVLQEIYLPITGTGGYIKPYAWNPEQLMRLIRDNETGVIYLGIKDDIGRIHKKNKVAETKDYKLSTINVKNPNNFEMTLIYTGKQGDIIKFLYREFADDMARPAFNVEVSYDLKEGNEVAFRKAKLKVLKATNSSITYIVLKNFN